MVWIQDRSNPMSPSRPMLAVVAASIATFTACAWFEPAALPPPEPEAAPDAPPPASTNSPDVVLITLDTTRADHLKRYGYFRDTMPGLEALADGALVFDRLIVPMATTLPSHTSLLTGVWPHEHGVLGNVEHGGERFIPSDHLQSLVSILAAHGYQTAAFTSAAPLNTDSGIQRGFQTFNAAPKAERSGDQTTDAALRWVADAPRTPMLLWVHYYDPHNPWTAPARFREGFDQDGGAIRDWMESHQVARVTHRPTGEQVNARGAMDAYDAELRFMDNQLTRLFDGLAARGRLDKTLIVLVGDHGEGLNQHNEPGHGLVWEEQLHSPLLVIAPGAAARRVPGVLSMPDVFPTALGLVDLPGEAEFLAQASGKDVLAADYTPRGVLSQTSIRQLKFGVPQTYTLTSDTFKCEWAADGTTSLWDHASDPYELAPVTDAARLDPCVSEGKALVDAQIARGKELGGHREKLSDAEIERLRQLGYVEEAPPPTKDAPKPPPADQE